MAAGTRIDPETLKAALAPSPDCVTLEDLAKLHEAGLAGAGDPGAAEHVARCLRCGTELALLADFEAAAPRPTEKLAAHWIAAQLDRDVARMTARTARPPGAERAGKAGRRGWPRAALRPAATTLALAAAAILLVVNLRGEDVRAPALAPDAGSAPMVLRSSAVTLLAPADDLDRAPAELRWEAVPGAASYSVTLTEVDRTEVWQAEVREPSAPLPATVRARIVPGKPLLWHVVARDAAGAVVATSPMQRFRVPLQRPHATR